MRFQLAGLLIGCIMALGFNCAARAAQSPVTVEQQTPAMQALVALQERTNHTAHVTMHPATGVARFVRLEPTSWQSPVQSAGITDQAQIFLQDYGALFGVRDPSQELQLTNTFSDAIGGRHLVYQQYYRGIPVFAGELRIHFDAHGALAAINGVFVPDLTVDPAPGLSEPAARTLALDHVAQQTARQRQASPANLDAMQGQLYIFRANLARGQPGSTHLVYEILVSNGQNVREFVYIDAHTGDVVDQISGLHPAIQRRVYKDTTFLDPKAMVWSEGDALPYQDVDPSVQTNINKIIEYNEDVYNFFAGLSGGAFLSWNGADGLMNNIYDHNAIGCPNANWNGASTNYCLDVITDDLVGHEWAHAYTQSTHNLVYQWQPGALNEAYSDIWGETIDLINNAGGDSPDARRTDNACSIFANLDGVDHSKRWLLFEDSRGFGQALRDMWNPGCFGDPGKVSDVAYFCSAADNGGVHTNSSIASHAYALLVDGGAYNGQMINGIGLTKAANIYWRAQTLYQTPTSDFADHADALEQACTDLVGAPLYALDTTDPAATNAAETISAADCAEVAKAIAAVELRAEPVRCNFPTNLHPDAPSLCPAEAPLVTLIMQDWETGMGAWSVGRRAVVSEATFSTADWAVVTSLPDSRTGAAAFVADERLGDGVTDIETGVLFLESPPLTLPVEALAPRLAFDHWFATQPGRDGGVLSIRVNDGPWQLVPREAFIFNPYSGLIFSGGVGEYTDSTAPIYAFQGTNYATFDTGTWGQSQVNLLELAAPGDTVQFRLEMILDAQDGVHGWYVDDVQAYYCQSCGNGQVNDGEQCDDGNTTGGDGCSALCQVEPSWFCKDPASAPGAQYAAGVGASVQHLNVAGTGAGSHCIPLQPNYCSHASLPIPDGDITGVASTVVITPQVSGLPPADLWLTDLDVYVQVQHTWLGDLSLSLTHQESGRTITLLDRPGSSGPGAFGCSGNDMDVLFDDEGSAAAEADCDSQRIPALRGNRRPGAGNSDGDLLQTFQGEWLAGHWTITAVDNAVDEQGILMQWCLAPTVGAPANQIFLPVVAR